MQQLTAHLLLALVVTNCALAHDTTPSDPSCNLARQANLVVQQPVGEPATMTIVSPQPGETLSNRSFKILYTLQGDLQAARLDHIHWKLSEGDNITAPDLSGVIDVTALREGDHTLVVYMATPEHVVITQKYTINFRVVTMGAVVLSPANNDILPSTNVPIYYNSFGTLPEEALFRLQLDGEEAVIDPDTDGVYTFIGVSNGGHQVSVTAVDTAGNPLGDGAVSTFSVLSALSGANANKAYNLSKKALKRTKMTQRKQALNQLRNLLQEMSAGGDSNPDSIGLTHQNIAQALKLLSRAEKKPKDDVRLKKLRNLLEEMSQ